MCSGAWHYPEEQREADQGYSWADDGYSMDDQAWCLSEKRLGYL